jgi:hypothetical protein
MKCSVLVKPETVLVNQISVSVFSGEVQSWGMVFNCCIPKLKDIETVSHHRKRSAKMPQDALFVGGRYHDLRKNLKFASRQKFRDCQGQSFLPLEVS